ncbi:RNP-1 like RNA-binding protein [Nitzschia inconspicua]|uniref:RNP-1 like RNA-binding protein n=1 Tax=Nitzschia inconspicua TaxID=303405 RepID=A0A9K3KR85_9STRA|nr:RNP-1 like RNA-binding protein [Nitzschia inconspicua]
MPAVSVLPLGSSSITATYKDIVSATVPSSAEVLKVQEVGSKVPPPPSKVEAGGENPNPTDIAIMESSKGTTGQEGPNSSAQKEEVTVTNAATDTSEKITDPDQSKVNGIGKDGNPTMGTSSPSHSSSSMPQGFPSHGTPQQGYYMAYNNSHVTPEPPSPQITGATVYDVGSFFQQAAGFQNSPFGAVPTHHYGASGQPQPPASPNSQSIPPASPLFPRITNPSTAALLSAARGELSPGPRYISGSTEEFASWGDNRMMQYPPSPQISGHGIPIPYVPGMPLPRSVSDRSASFDDSMLPPSADSLGLGIGQAGGGAVPGTLFAHQQAWGYGAPPHEMYGVSSPLQARPTVPYPGQHGGPPQHPHSRHHPQQHMPPFGGQYYPAASPGPPIQTTASNKGPDGANLFIFHIPNHFTNVDMYQLFYPYGNLLSVRIMVEKDSGRSRGFGFVSYDSPDAAALAIKELNGYAIGNKRLKVQHKQIRPSDQQYEKGHGGFDDDPYGTSQGGGAYGTGRGSMNLPPSGPMAASVGWYSRQAPLPPTGGTIPQEPSAGMEGPPYSGEDPGVVAAVAPPAESAPPDGSGPEGGSTGTDPLSSMEPLRQTLPDVGTGVATSAAEGES